MTPDYYNKDGLECLDVISRTQSKEMYRGFLDGNIKKYMWRYRDKNGIEDLKKAQHYLELLIELESMTGEKGKTPGAF